MTTLRPGSAALFGTLLLSCLLGLISGPPFLQGTVYSLTEGLALPEARVTLAVSGVTVETDLAGQFSFEPGAATPDDTLVVAAAGYVPARIPLGASGGEGWNLRVRLLQEPVAVGDTAR